MSKVSVKVVANALAFTSNGEMVEEIGNGPKTVKVGKTTINRVKEENTQTLQGEDEMLKW